MYESNSRMKVKRINLGMIYVHNSFQTVSF